MNIGWRMEREEAIFENENNSNLESESNNRQQLSSLNEENIETLQTEEEKDERNGVQSQEDDIKRSSFNDSSHSRNETNSNPNHSEKVESKEILEKTEKSQSLNDKEDKDFPKEGNTTASDGSIAEQVKTKEPLITVKEGGEHAKEDGENTQTANHHTFPDTSVRDLPQFEETVEVGEKAMDFSEENAAPAHNTKLIDQDANGDNVSDRAQQDRQDTLTEEGPPRDQEMDLNDASKDRAEGHCTDLEKGELQHSETQSEEVLETNSFACNSSNTMPFKEETSQEDSSADIETKATVHANTSPVMEDVVLDQIPMQDKKEEYSAGVDQTDRENEGVDVDPVTEGIVEKRVDDEGDVDPVTKGNEEERKDDMDPVIEGNEEERKDDIDPVIEGNEEERKDDIDPVIEGIEEGMQDDRDVDPVTKGAVNENERKDDKEGMDHAPSETDEVEMDLSDSNTKQTLMKESEDMALSHEEKEMDVDELDTDVEKSGIVISPNNTNIKEEAKITSAAIPNEADGTVNSQAEDDDRGTLQDGIDMLMDEDDLLYSEDKSEKQDNKTGSEEELLSTEAKQEDFDSKSAHVDLTHLEGELKDQDVQPEKDGAVSDENDVVILESQVNESPKEQCSAIPGGDGSSSAQAETAMDVDDDITVIKESQEGESESRQEKESEIVEESEAHPKPSHQEEEDCKQSTVGEIEIADVQSVAQTDEGLKFFEVKEPAPADVFVDLDSTSSKPSQDSGPQQSKKYHKGSLNDSVSHKDDMKGKKNEDDDDDVIEIDALEKDSHKKGGPANGQHVSGQDGKLSAASYQNLTTSVNSPMDKAQEAKASNDDADDDVIVMQEIKKESDIDYKVPETIVNDTKPEIIDTTKLKSEVIVLDDEFESSASKKMEANEMLEPGLGIQIAAVSGQQHQLHANACDGSVSALTSASAADSEKTSNKSPSKSKTQTCIVCNTVTKCKYNIVRNGDTKQLCGDVCFKKFRSNPNRYLQKEKANNSGTAPSKLSQCLTRKDPPQIPLSIFPKSTQSSATPSSPPTATSTGPANTAPVESISYKTCHVCQVMNINTKQIFFNWKGLDFCGESCLAKFQATLNNTCSFCNIYIPIDMRASLCLKIGNDMRPFCKQKCYQEFKKNLRMCAYCQKDLLSLTTVTAKVGMESKAREFCSMACVKKLEGECDDVQIVSVQMGKKSENGTCSVCKVQGRPLKHSVRFQSKVFNLCSDICLSAFQYTNKINVNKCDSCGIACTSIEAQVHFIQFEGNTKRFCSDKCVNNFRMGNRKIVECTWCEAKKINFDMIERLDEDNKFQLFCSLNCLSLYRVNLQAKSNQAVQCDQCKKVVPAQYHLTMSDASVRNFCSYSCVMTFQSQFTQKAVPQRKAQQQTQSLNLAVQHQQQQQQQQQHQPPRASAANPHGTRSKGRSKNLPSQTEAPSPSLQPSYAPSVPVISDVISLAADGDKNANASVQAANTAASILQTLQKKGNLFSGDGKERIVIQPPLPTTLKNRSVQCRPITQTKATSCRPHSQNKEVQTEKEPEKSVIVPVPVPIYVPMPTVMYNVPTPVPFPIPIPIPVPVFIPTTRKSANGILRTIKEIAERMPADPLEAELLMMAEAVATDGKKPGDSDTDSEQDMGTNDYEDADMPEMQPLPMKGTNSLLMRKREGAGEEDMIQMALRMAEEMSGPIEDLESSVEPSVVKMEPPHQPEIEMPAAFEKQDPDYPPTRSGRGRGAKRQGRGRPPAGSRPKRQKTGPASYAEPELDTPPTISTPQLVEPPPDHNRRLKFTFGVNAWKNWVTIKNAELEKSRLAGNTRMRALPTDILKCTMDELNYSLCLFIKEVRKPNGEIYSPDSIFYLCLGIQQYLYENSRIDNIFTDLYFQRFTDGLHGILKTLQPKVNNQGQMLCRIEEEHLWESKQLGAHSPYILLNTLIYFHTKHFILKTASEHMSLSFAQILKHLKKGVPVKSGSGAASKNVSLRFYCLANKKDPSFASRKGKDGVPVFEVTENFANPLRCPVKLYEFFLSKCPESIKNRNDIFYPVPERSCVPDSPVWYSTQSVDITTMDKMLTRILLVREIQEAHLHAQAIYI